MSETRAEIEARKRVDAKTALYIDDDELRRRLNPMMGRDRFSLAIAAAEGEKSPGGLVFPKVSTLFGGRYWPQVIAYLDDFEKAKEHVADDNEATDQPQPKADARFRKKARPQVYPPDGAALLVREAGGAKPDGVSGSVHRLAARG